MQPQLKIYHGKHIIKCKIVLKIKFKEQTQVIKQQVDEHCVQNEYVSTRDTIMYLVM